MSGFAWVTLATNDSYSLGALVLAHSLKQVATKHQLVVLITPGVTNAMREKLSGVFNLVEEVNPLDSKDEANLRLLKRPELGITFTKLHCWRLVQFQKCVFLDADTLVLSNSDELFDREEFSAAPDVGWPDCFNSGVFVYTPSNETYSKLVEFALQKGSFDGGDQGLLNLYFSDWAHKDIAKHLPFIYNMCSTAVYSYLPAFKQYGKNAKIVHFIGPAKPWLQYFNTENLTVYPSPGLQHLEGILQKWWNIFCSLIHPNLSQDMSGLAGAFAQFTLGAKRSAGQDALENHLRRQAWEVGNIDYLGRDSFDHIWSKICESLSAPLLETAAEPVAQIETTAPPQVVGDLPTADTTQEILCTTGSAPSAPKAEEISAVDASTAPTVLSEPSKPETISTDAPKTSEKPEPMQPIQVGEVVSTIVTPPTPTDATKIDTPISEGVPPLPEASKEPTTEAIKSDSALPEVIASRPDVIPKLEDSAKAAIQKAVDTTEASKKQEERGASKKVAICPFKTEVILIPAEQPAAEVTPAKEEIKIDDKKEVLPPKAEPEKVDVALSTPGVEAAQIQAEPVKMEAEPAKIETETKQIEAEAKKTETSKIEAEPTKIGEPSKTEVEPTKLELELSKIEGETAKIEGELPKIEGEPPKVEMEATKAESIVKEEPAKVEGELPKVEPMKTEAEPTKIETVPSLPATVEAESPKPEELKVEPEPLKVEVLPSKPEAEPPKIEGESPEPTSDLPKLEAESKQQSESPKVETDSPKAETELSKVETELPKVEKESAEVDAESLKVETELAKVEAVSPKVEAETPKVEAETPKSELPKLEADPSKPESPKIEPEPPKVEAEPPKIAAEPPKVEAEPPKVETEPPKVETEPPKVETEPLKVETESPKAETEPPKVETEPPKVEAELPKVETEPPKVETEPSKVEAESPKEEAVSKPAETAEQKAELTKETEEKPKKKVVKKVKKVPKTEPGAAKAESTASEEQPEATAGETSTPTPPPRKTTTVKKVKAKKP